MSQVRLVVVDDQPLIRDSLKVLLQSMGPIEVVAAGSDGIEALELTRTHQPDVVLLDIRMPRMNGIEACRRIKAAFADTRVILLTAYEDEDEVVAGIRAGADGYLLKGTSAEELVRAVLTENRREMVLSPTVARMVANRLCRDATQAAYAPARGCALTPRESQVLQLMAEGLGNAVIAERLRLSEGTVKNYTSRIYQKLDVADRAQALVRARRTGLV